MPRAVVLSTAPEEAALVRQALAEGLCSLESLSSYLGVGKSTLSCWLNGHRAPPAGLLLATLRHLDQDAGLLLARLQIQPPQPERIERLSPLAQAAALALLSALVEGAAGWSRSRVRALLEALRSLHRVLIRLEQAAEDLLQRLPPEPASAQRRAL